MIFDISRDMVFSIRSGMIYDVFDTSCIPQIGDLSVWETHDNDDVICELEKLKRSGALAGRLILKYEEKILQLKDPKVSYYFASNVVGADIYAHGQVVIESGNLLYNYLFARDIKGAIAFLHGQKVIESKDLTCNFLFARDNEGAAVEALGHVESKALIFYFARDVAGANVKALGQAIIESKDLEYNYLFALFVKGADIAAHAQVVLESKDPRYNYLFARDVAGANVKAHYKVAKNDAFYRREFIRTFGAKLDAFERRETFFPKVVKLLNTKVKRLEKNNYK